MFCVRVFVFASEKLKKKCDKPVIRLVCYQNRAKTIYQSLTRALLCKLQNLAGYKSFLFGTPIHRLLIERFPF